MSSKILNKRIPTLLALLILVISLGVLGFLTNTQTNIIGFASLDSKPNNLRITNISHDSFTISFTTAKPVLASISYGDTSELNQTSLDERSQSEEIKKRTTHSFKITNLTPDTEYFFSIISGGTAYKDNNNFFTVKTSKKFSSSSVLNFVSGKINLSNGTSSEEVLVYLSTNGGEVLSTTTNSEGSFLIKFSDLKTENLSTLIEINNESTFNLIALNDKERLGASFLLKNSNPLPVMFMSQEYNFVNEESSENEISSESAVLKQFPTFNAVPKEVGEIDITSPKNSESFVDAQPEFEGKAMPNEEIEIIVNSLNEQKAIIQSKPDGSWSFRPEQPLEPGNHTVSIKTRDRSGIFKTITRSFTVYAQGSQFIEPSVSPVKTPSPTSSVAPTSQVIQQITPTTNPSPSEEVSATPSPTAIPTSILTPTLTPRPSIQPTGSNAGYSMYFISTILVLSGIILIATSKTKII